MTNSILRWEIRHHLTDLNRRKFIAMSHLSSKRAFKIIIPLVIVLVAFVILHSRLRHTEKLPVADQFPWALETAVVTKGNVRSVFPALGHIESSSELKIAPQISGTVLETGPRGGVSVKKGDLLLHIDTSELEANLDALRAKVTSAENTADFAKREYEREKKLLAEGGSSKSATENREAKMKAAIASLNALLNQIKSLEVKVSYGHIYAPFDADVVERLVEKGDTVFPGKPAYILSVKKGGRVVIPIPLETLSRVKIGGEVELRYGTRKISLNISRINPALDKLAMGNLEIDTPERPFGLPDAAPVSALVVTGSIKNTLIVPPDALVPSDNDTNRTVYKIDNDRSVLIKTPVILDFCGLEGCAIESQSLEKGDIIARGHGSVLLKLHDGDPVVTESENSEDTDNNNNRASGANSSGAVVQ